MLTNSPTHPPKTNEPITPEIIDRVEARLRAARTKMFFKGNWAFFGYLAMHLKMHAVADLGTCATDGDHFLYDPLVLDQERLEWLEFNWAHEVLHLFGLDLSLKPKDDIMVVGVDKKGRAATAPTSVWNLACFPAGTVVPGDYKPIEDLKVGDGIFGENGLQKVKATMKRPYKGKLHRIKASGLLPFEATDEHPVMVAERKPGMPVKLKFPVRWKKASEIRPKTDYLVVPVLAPSFNMTKLDVEKYIDRTETNGHDQAHNVKDSVKGGIPLDEEMAWIMGLWCAEGSLTTSTFDGICFTLNMKEQNYIDRIVRFADSFGYKSSVTSYPDGDHSAKVVVTSRIFAKLFIDLMGRGAKNKRIPEIILLHENVALLRAFVEGLLAGDGCQARPNERDLGTVSKILALQVQSAIVRFGEFANVNVVEKPAGRMIRGKVLPAETLYTVQWIKPKVFVNNLAGGPTPCHKERWKKFGDEYVFVPVTEVSTRNFSGDVFNVETEDHTYTVSNAVVHNCDLFNNLKLEEEGFTVPPFVAIDKKYKGWTKLEIFEDLKKTAKANGTASLPQGTCCGGFVKKPGGKLSDVKDLDAWKPGKSESEKWANLAKEALEASKSRGKSPAFAESLIHKLLQPRQNWREILWQFVQRVGKEWRFTPPSRTGAARNVVLPRIVPEDQIEHGVLVFDTSGSVGDSDLEDYLAEVNAICTTIRLKVTVIMCDADVHDVYEFEPGEFNAKALKFTGRGGTDFRPAFLRVRDMAITPTFLVYFTDSYGVFPTKPPDYPVLWALSVAPGDKEPVPWGTIIHLRHEVY